MTYSKTLLKRFASGVLVLALVPSIASAAVVLSAEQVALPAGESVSGNAYLFGGSVVSGAPVGGDLVASGGTVVVNSPVGGDLAAAAGNLSVLSDIKGDARVAGGTLVLSGAIGGDLIGAGGQFTVTGARVGGDVLVAGGTITIDAPVSGSVRIRGGSVVIDAPIAGNLEVHAQSLSLGPKAVVSGDLTYEAPKAAKMQEGAVIKGKTSYTPIVDVSAGPAAAVALLSVWILSMLAALVVSALIIRILFRKYVVELGRAVVARPWRALALGFIILVAVPAATLVMCLTLVGLPLGVLTGLGYAALLVFSWMSAPFVVGAYIETWWHKRTPELPWQVVVYGALAYALIGLLPIIGGLFKFAVMLIAIGAVVEKKWEIASEWV